MNKLNFIKTLICTLVIFSLASCGVKETTGTGGANSLLQTIIESGNLAALSGSTDALVNNTLAHLTDSANYTADTEIVAIYATETGSGNESGTHWNNAVAAANLRNRINNITDASASKVYAVLVAGGTYKPTYDDDRTISFSMKNHVAVIGGFDATGSWEFTGTTTFSGDIGTAIDDTDNTYNVFNHSSVTLDNALLYGVTISDGRANGKDGTLLAQGAGMYNLSSSPRLFNVVFSGNSASMGGGMLNSSSSARLFNVVFSSNSSKNGGGMYNYSSTPVLTGVVFTGNSAEYGGGIYNRHESSPRLFNVVFSGNSATLRGGGIHNDNDAKVGPLIVNAIFAGNTAPSGQDIGMNLDANGPAGETIRIAGSVLGIGANNPTDGIGSTGNSRLLNLSYHSLANGVVNFGANATLGGFTYPTIQRTSSAVDIGLYVRRSGTDYYFSEDNATWYTNFTTTGVLTGPAGTPPAGAEDLTATDVAGNPRVGRPDAGVYEYRP